MNAREELVQRLSLRHAQERAGLSEAGRAELLGAIRANPATFVSDAEDAAFYQLVLALERHDRSRADDDLIEDDEAYFAARSSRLRRLADDCRAALAIDADCLDAALVATLADDGGPASTLEALLALGDHCDAGDHDRLRNASWDDVRARPALRLAAAISRSYLETSRYRLAARACRALLEADGSDHLGARRTCALAYARLEDGFSLESLERGVGWRDDAWSHLARTILHYKLGHAAAARRALDGYARLISGGAYALLRPVVIDTYLPDRPTTPPRGYDEAALAVWEAEPIIVDIPDFPSWASRQDAVSGAARAFAERNDLDW